jgi:membrane fusion protein (multidrug efflux system)
MKVSAAPLIILSLVALPLTACHPHDEHAQHEAHHKIVLTSPAAKDVVFTQQYVCQIRSRKMIEVQALQEGYLEEITIKEGQAVKRGEVLFRILPTLYKTRLDAEQAKADVARIKYEQSKVLAGKNVVSAVDVQLAEAEMNEAKARANQAKAELDFTVVTANFDGIVDRLYKQQGSLVEKKDALTSLSDNGVMWVYFNVPEARHLEYQALLGSTRMGSQLKLADARIELVLADGSKFDQTAGDAVTVEGKFNNETGNIPYRADFPNPRRVLRHGQTGTVLIHRTLHNVVVIPQRATFEILDKRYVFVVDKDDVIRQREVAVQNELEDVFVIRKGLDPTDRIVLEGVRQVHHGEKVPECEFRKPAEALAHQKNHAE